MIYWHIFLAFFLPGIFGFGGGPASIPLIEKEVVDRYEWQTVSEFSETLALGNALPSRSQQKWPALSAISREAFLGQQLGCLPLLLPH